MDRLELQAAIMKKSMEDESFKEMFLKDPKGTISKEFGVNLSDKITVNALEEGASTLTLFVPASQSELSEDDLDNVAGGWCIGKMKGVCTVEF